MTGTPAALEFEFPPEPERLRWLRETLREELQRIAVSSDVANTVVLVVDEIVSNAIEHASSYRDGGHLMVRLEHGTGRLAMVFEDPDVPGNVVEDLARALEASRGQPPNPLAERGRGLFLVSECMVDPVISPRDGGGLHLRGSFDDDAT